MGASKAHPLGDLCSISVYLACGIVWLLIATGNLNNSCLDNANEIAGYPNIATWLIIEGAFLIGSACIQILLFPCKHIEKARKNFPGAKVLLWANNIWVFISGLFHLAWLIVGAVQLSKGMSSHRFFSFYSPSILTPRLARLLSLFFFFFSLSLSLS